VIRLGKISGNPALHNMVDIELQVINPTFFFQYLKGHCHGNQFCGKITYPPFTYHSGISKEMGYHYLNVRINSVNDASISCKNFLNFGQVNLEKTGLICEVLYGMAKNGVFSRI